jgi:F-type H+-transporting ATPase subunit a
MLFAAAEHAEHHEPHPVREVSDTSTWEFFHFMFGGVSWELPSINLGFIEFQITKYMILELIAAGLILAIYLPLARRIREGGLPRGRFWNFFEGMLVFVRDEIARPNLDAPKNDHGHGEQAHGHGHEEHAKELAKEHAEEHEADKYVPFLWTLFLFVLFCNLLGMIPMMGSPTASLWMTLGLAIPSFILMHAVGMGKYGVVQYFANLWPKLGLALIPVSALIFFIELMGTFIKGGVLAVRLFANMFAGHMVLAYLLFFIYVVGKEGLSPLWVGVTFASVLGVVALSLLELFVAFLQAYIFTFLTALFMGMSLHAEH